MKPPYPKTRKRSLTSHLVGVPISEDISAVCLVLWQSKHFKDVISLAITSARLPHGEYPDQIFEIESAIDTVGSVIRSGNWHLGPKVNMTTPIEISTRIVAGQIYCDDVVVRERQEADKSTIPELSAAGMDYVRDYIMFLDAGAPDGLAFRQDREVMNLHLQNYTVEIAV